jgi:hypothetical protein
MDDQNQPFIYNANDDFPRRYRRIVVVPNLPYEVRIPARRQNSQLPEVFLMCPDTGEETRMTPQEIPEGVTAARPIGNVPSLCYTLGCDCHALTLLNYPRTNGLRDRLYSWGYQIWNIISDFLQI